MIVCFCNCKNNPGFIFDKLETDTYSMMQIVYCAVQGGNGGERERDQNYG